MKCRQFIEKSRQVEKPYQKRCGAGVGWGVVGDHVTYHLEFMISFRTTEVSSDVGGINTDSCCVTSNSSGK